MEYDICPIAGIMEFWNSTSDVKIATVLNFIDRLQCDAVRHRTKFYCKNLNDYGDTVVIIRYKYFQNDAVHHLEFFKNSNLEAKASAPGPGASNKLGEWVTEWMTEWLIEYAIFLHGLAQQRRKEI